MTTWTIAVFARTGTGEQKYTSEIEAEDEGSANLRFREQTYLKDEDQYKLLQGRTVVYVDRAHILRYEISEKQGRPTGVAPISRF